MLHTVTLLNYDLTTEGLSISYALQEKELSFIATPEQTVHLFKTLGLIDDYDLYHEEPVILFEAQEGYEDEYGQQYRRTGTAWMYWPDFVKDFRASADYSDKVMQIIVEHHEEQKRVQAVLGSVGLVFNALKDIA